MDRFVGCHSICEKYKEFSKEVEAERKEREKRANVYRRPENLVKRFKNTNKRHVFRDHKK